MSELAGGASGSPRSRKQHRRLLVRPFVVRLPIRVLAADAGGMGLERPDRLATEEPMAIQVRGRHQEPVSVAVTMRTPGNDFELAAGFLRERRAHP